MAIISLKSALQRIAQLERENEQLRAELEVYKNRNTGGRKKHDEAWMTSYRDFAVKYESGMTIMEIVAEGEISRRTACIRLIMMNCRKIKEICMSEGTKRNISVVKDADGNKIVVINDILFKGKRISKSVYWKGLFNCRNL